MNLELSHYNRDGVEVVLVGGELDLDTTPKLRELIIDLTARHYELVLDLERLEFLDSTALHDALLAGLKLVRDHSGSMDLVCTRDRILKVFRITGLSRVFAIYSSVDEAIAARRDGSTLTDTRDSLRAQWAEPHAPEVASDEETELRIFLANGSRHAAVQSALDGVLADHGIVDPRWEDPVKGSWDRRGKAKATVEELQRIAIELRRAAELQALDIPQSRVDAAEGDAVAKLLTALSGEPNAVIQIGSILLVKSDGVPAVRNLTQFELAVLQRNPELLTQPSIILLALQDANQQHEAHGAVRADRSLSPQDGRRGETEPA